METVFFVILYAILAATILAAGFVIFIMPIIIVCGCVYTIVDEVAKSSRWWELRQIDRRTEEAARKMEADHNRVMEEIDRLTREHRRLNP